MRADADEDCGEGDRSVPEMKSMTLLHINTGIGVIYYRIKCRKIQNKMQIPAFLQGKKPKEFPFRTSMHWDQGRTSCFFVNQLSKGHTVEYGKASGDFLVDGHITIEVGGKDKTFEQIANLPDSYIFADEIEFPVGKKLPLWLAGFLY